MLVSSCAQRTSRPEVEESLSAKHLSVVSSRAFTLSEAKGSDLSRPCREGSAVSSLVVAITLSNFVGEGSSPVMPGQLEGVRRYSSCWRYPGNANQHCQHRSEEHTSELQSLRHLVC